MVEVPSDVGVVSVLSGCLGSGERVVCERRGFSPVSSICVALTDTEEFLFRLGVNNIGNVAASRRLPHRHGQVEPENCSTKVCMF